MRFMKKLTDAAGKKRQVLVLQGEQAIASRGMYNTAYGEKRPVVNVLFTVKQARDGRTGEIIDGVELELSLEEANKFASDLLATIDAIMPRRARGAIRVPWGE